MHVHAWLPHPSDKTIDSKGRAAGAIKHRARKPRYSAPGPCIPQVRRGLAASAMATNPANIG